MDEELPPSEIPKRVIFAAYLLSALCLIVPLAVVGAVFAGVVLIRRGRVVDGVSVVVLGVLGTVLAVTMFR